MSATLTSVTADEDHTSKCAAQGSHLQMATQGVVRCAKDAASAMTHEVALEECNTMQRFRKSSKVLFNVNDFSYDLDGDGAITQDEKKVQKHLTSVAGPDGNIMAENMHQLLLKMGLQNKSKRILKLVLVLSLAMLVCMVGAMVGVVWTANAAFVNADKKTSSTSQRVTAMDGDVVGTAAVKAYLPLRAAPVLSIERLASVSELTVQIHNYPSAGLPGPPSLTASAAEGTFDKVYHVTSAERHSDTEVYFQTASPGHVIHIKDGEALIKVFDVSGNLTWSASICYDSVTCAALRVDTEAEAKELLATADKAVARRRLELPDVASDRRQLYSRCDTDPSYDCSCDTDDCSFPVATMTCAVTDPLITFCTSVFGASSFATYKCLMHSFCNAPCVCCSYKKRFCQDFDTTFPGELANGWSDGCAVTGGTCSTGRRLLANDSEEEDEVLFEREHGVTPADEFEMADANAAKVALRRSRRLDKCAAGR